jgi:hypothetical protein
MTSNKPAASNKPPGQTNHPRLPEYPTTTQGEDSSNKLSSNARTVILTNFSIHME